MERPRGGQTGTAGTAQAIGKLLGTPSLSVAWRAGETTWRFWLGCAVRLTGAGASTSMEVSICIFRRGY